MMATTAPTSDHPSDDAWLESLSAHRSRQTEHILESAIAIIASDGIAGLSMSTLAAGAGISRQTLYKYFADIDAVLMGLAAMASTMDAELVARIEAEPDAISGLRAFISAIVDAAASGHPSPFVLAASLPREARAGFDAHSARAEAVVVELVRRGQEEGSFRVDLDPGLDGRIVYRAILGIHDLAAEPSVDRAGLVEHVFGALVSGLRVASRSRSRRR